MYYLHIENEGGYPKNAIANQRCTEENSCDTGKDQFYLSKEYVDFAVRRMLDTASTPVAEDSCVQFQEAPSEARGSLTEFIEYLEGNVSGGKDMGLVVKFDETHVESGAKGQMGYIKPSEEYPNAVKAVLLQDKSEMYTHENEEGSVEGWRAASWQYHSDSALNYDYYWQEEPGLARKRFTYAIETTLLHEIGHAMGLSHHNRGLCDWLVDKDENEDCWPFPVMRPASTPWTVARRWESEDESRLQDIYECGSAKILFDMNFDDLSTQDDGHHDFGGITYRFSKNGGYIWFWDTAPNLEMVIEEANEILTRIALFSGAVVH